MYAFRARTVRILSRSAGFWPLLLLGLTQVTNGYAQTGTHLADSSLPRYSFLARRPDYSLPGYWYPPSLKLNILAQTDRSPVKLRRADGTTARGLMPDNPDYMHFLADDALGTRGRLVVNQEMITLKSRYPGLGQGGAMSLLDVELSPESGWRLQRDPLQGDTIRLVYFAPVGYTSTNCGGGFLPNGNYLTGEEIFDAFRDPQAPNRNYKGQPQDNFDLDAAEAGYRKGRFRIPADVPDFGGREIAHHENFGYMVEVDPARARALRKIYHMGRFSHESAVVMPDRQTVYLTDDYQPACLFKYVADKPGQYQSGDLYAFRQLPGKDYGTWLRIERQLDSLIDARGVAIRKGASLFMRLEWGAVNPRTGRVYIAETGVDSFAMRPYLQMAGKLASVAPHWEPAGIYDPQTQICDHPYGAVLELEDLEGKPTIRALLMGGDHAEEGWNFASVDGISYARTGGRDWLILQEDLIKVTRGRMPPTHPDKDRGISEAFLLDLAIEEPTLADLHRVFASSPGAELSGALFTPQARGFFINDQHPNTSNPPPYHRSAVLALTGYELEMSRMEQAQRNRKRLEAVASPALATLFFNQPVNYQLQTASGTLLRRVQARDFVKFASLPAGEYLVKLESGPRYVVTLR